MAAGQSCWTDMKKMGRTAKPELENRGLGIDADRVMAGIWLIRALAMAYDAGLCSVCNRVKRTSATSLSLPLVACA